MYPDKKRSGEKEEKLTNEIIACFLEFHEKILFWAEHAEHPFLRASARIIRDRALQELQKVSECKEKE